MSVAYYAERKRKIFLYELIFSLYKNYVLCKL